MPLSDTLDTALRDYQIGAKVHALRMSKKMGLVELGKHSGLSPALLSIHPEPVDCHSTPQSKGRLWTGTV